MIPLRDVIPTRTTPAVTLTLIVVNLLIFAYGRALDAEATRAERERLRLARERDGLPLAQPDAPGAATWLAEQLREGDVVVPQEAGRGAA